MCSQSEDPCEICGYHFEGRMLNWEALRIKAKWQHTEEFERSPFEKSIKIAPLHKDNKFEPVFYKGIGPQIEILPCDKTNLCLPEGTDIRNVTFQFCINSLC